MPNLTSVIGQALLAVDGSFDVLALAAALPDQDPFDPAWIGIEHLEFEAAGVRDDLAARRNTVEKREDQPAERVDVLSPVFVEKFEAEVFLKVFNFHPRVGFEGAVRPFRQAWRQDLVMLVLDLADNFLDQIFDGDHAVGAAIFIDHDRHMRAGVPHLHQEVENLHRGRHEQEFAHDRLQFEMFAISPKRQEILQMHHARDVIERLAHDGHPRMGALPHRGDHLIERRGDVERLDVGSRHHHVPELKLAEREGIQEDRTFFLAERRRALLIVGFVFLDQLFKRLAKGAPVAILLAPQGTQSRQERLYQCLSVGSLVAVGHVRHGAAAITAGLSSLFAMAS